jgi:hypothetical protein
LLGEGEDMFLVFGGGRKAAVEDADRGFVDERHLFVSGVVVDDRTGGILLLPVIDKCGGKPA